MTFKEEFPSLKDKQFALTLIAPIGVDKRGCEPSTVLVPNGSYLKLSDVEKDCLDKQRVREAIQNISTLSLENLDEGVWIDKRQLLQELGF